MLWAQLSLLAGVEEVVAMHPRARISIFVDDATVSAEDDDVAACVATVVAAADQLAAVVENELGATWQRRRRQRSGARLLLWMGCGLAWASTQAVGTVARYL